MARATWDKRIYDSGCTNCPRLVTHLSDMGQKHPDYFNAPVPPFGASRPELLIVGLAPGAHGANATGRPFTGDHAGILLYRTLYEFGLSSRPQSTDRADGLRLKGCRITNAVKCLPPANKPSTDEIRQCNVFLKAELAALGSPLVIVALGRIAHDAVLMAEMLRRSSHAFGHGRTHRIGDGRWLVDSYHCSRYNTQTRRLTETMFRSVFRTAVALAAAGEETSQKWKATSEKK